MIGIVVFFINWLVNLKLGLDILLFLVILVYIMFLRGIFDNCFIKLNKFNFVFFFYLFILIFFL